MDIFFVAQNSVSFLHTKDEQSPRRHVFGGDETFRMPLYLLYLCIEMKILYNYLLHGLTKKSFKKKVIKSYLKKKMCFWMKRDEAVVSVETLWLCAGHQSGREDKKSYLTFL